MSHTAMVIVWCMVVMVYGCLGQESSSSLQEVPSESYSSSNGTEGQLSVFPPIDYIGGERDIFIGLVDNGGKQETLKDKIKKADPLLSKLKPILEKIDKKFNNGTSEETYVPRRKRETPSEEEGVEEGDGAEKLEGTEGEEENGEVEELPTPESLAWIDPAGMANRGYAFENVPSLANFMGLRVVKYGRNNPPPPSRLGTASSAYPPGRYRPRPAQYPNFNRNMPSKPVFNRPDTKPLTYDNDLFGDTFHNSFHSYYKEEDDKLPYSNSHGPPPGHTSWRRNNQLSSGESRYSPSLPANGRFPQHPYPPGGGLMDMLDPLNLFKNNQPPYQPRNPNPVPPPGYDPRRIRTQQRPNPSDPRSTIRGRPEYEVDVNKDEDKHGYAFQEDFPLRDDLYIGKDGNIYIKDNENNPGPTIGQDPFEETRTPKQTKDRERPYRPRQRPGGYRPYSPRDQYQGENEYDEDRYRERLKNHNLGDYPSRDHPASGEDQFPEDGPSEKFPRQRQREQYPQLNGRFPNYGRPPYRQSWFPSLGLGDLLAPALGRVNYPSFFTDPRQVVLPGFRHPPRHHRIPPRAGTPVIPPNARPPPSRRPELSRSRPAFPNSSPPRLTFPNPSPARPSFPNPSPPRSAFGNQSPVRPSFSNPSPPRPQTPLSSPARPNYPFERPNSDQGKHLDTGHGGNSGRPDRDKGFYPGNGFFDANFPTVFNMAPSNRHRTIHRLPRPLHLNGTVVEEEEEKETTD